MKCRICEGKCVKDGFQTNGTQRYKCKECNKRQQRKYDYTAYGADINQWIKLFTPEGVGIRSTSRLLKISTNTLLRRIVKIANSISQPAVTLRGTYEVDEMRSFVRCKENLVWIVYALDRDKKEVVNFNVETRTKKTLDFVIETLRLSEAKKIYTDKLRHYKLLIKSSIHSTRLHSTNHIERHNLTIRTHLKRLTRKTICFSRSLTILTAILKIYFWG